MEAVFRQLDFEALVFGAFAAMSINVHNLLEMAVDYGAKHLGRTMAATTVEAVKATLRRRYMTQISIAA